VRRAILVLCACCAGCATFDTGSVARTRAAALLGCEDVEMEQLGAYRFRGTGCGDSVTVACTAAALEPVCIREAVGRRVTDEQPEQDEAVADTASPAIEAQIRAGLDARRADVLACAGVDRVGVRVAYAMDGSLDVTLQGDLRGGPEERCVQDALDGVRVDASDRAGVVIHLLR
jgi:hypothetical protein